MTVLSGRMSGKSVLVVGAGCFGVTAAKELCRRGYSVTIVDDLPNVDVESHPLAASTDISKLIRGDYGGDKLYTEMWLESIKGWRQLNADSGETIFHQTGLLVMSSPDPVASVTDSFEQKSLATQKEYNVPISLLSRDDIRARFPQWANGKYHGYLNEHGGWAESGKAVVALLKQVLRWSKAIYVCMFVSCFQHFFFFFFFFSLFVLNLSPGTRTSGTISFYSGCYPCCFSGC